jgi:NADP-dependent 3-hydroxy acid dehydrogenase YdfG
LSAVQGALAGQVAIVTGAGRGIGHAIALALARESATVVLASRTRQELAAAAATIRESGGAALAIPTDVAQDGAVEAMVEQAVAELGRVDILVTAAGVASFGPVVGTKPSDWDALLAVNLRAVMVSCRAVLPVMIRQRRGTIINIASVGSSRRSCAPIVCASGCWCPAPSTRPSGIRSGIPRTGAGCSAPRTWHGPRC